MIKAPDNINWGSTSAFFVADLEHAFVSWDIMSGVFLKATTQKYFKKQVHLKVQEFSRKHIA